MYLDATLWALTKGFRPRLFFCALVGLLSLAAGIARFALLGLFLARCFVGTTGLALWAPLVGALIAVLARAALEHALNCVANRNAAAIQALLRARLYDRLIDLGPAWVSGERTGSVAMTVVDGVEQLQVFFGRYLPQLCISICAPVAIFVFMAWWDVPVALVLLCAALLTLALPLIAHRSHRAASRQRQASFKAFGAEFLDAVQGLPTLKAFGQSRSWGERLAQRARALSDNTFQVLGREVSARFFTDIGITLGAACALTLGVWRVAHGQMSLAALLVILMAGTEIFRPLRDLRSALHNGMMGQSAAVGIRELLDAQPPQAPQASAIQTLAASGLQGSQGLALRFRHIGFTYPGADRPVHTDIDFHVEAGQRIGIVGPSGSGKSSLIKLLLGLYQPQQGVIEVGGRDIQSLSPEALRQCISIVAQDSVLFHGSISENLRMARPDATDEQLRNATRAANAHDFIMALPQGYDTVLNERGGQLSGGQRQRIAIARALLRDSPILILDEALSSVDAHNEMEISQALERASHGRTTLILAHRLSSIADADQIFVIDGGQIAERGTHESLMASDTLYRQLMGGQIHAADGELGDEARSPSLADAHESSRVPALEIATAETTDAPEPVELPTEPLTEQAEQIGGGQVMRFLTHIIAPWRRTFWITVICGIGRVSAFIGVSAVSALALAHLKRGEPDGGVLVGLFVVAVVAAGLHWIESWLAHAVAYELLAQLRIDLFRKLEALAPSYLLRRRTGDLVSLASQDVETIEYFFAHTVAPACVAVLVPLTILIILGVSAWPAMLALLPFLVWAGMQPLMGRRQLDVLGARAREALGLLSAHLAETLQGLADLVAFNATGARRERFLQAAQSYGRTRVDLADRLSLAQVLLDAATGLGGLAVAATAAAWMRYTGTDNTLLPLLVLLAGAAFLPVSEIAQVSRQLADTFASARRLCLVHDEPVRIQDGPLAPPTHAGGLDIAFEHVSFTYPGRQAAALQDISLRVPAGSTLALVGASGAGKSTIAHLLQRVWDPQAGQITLGDIALPQLTLDALHERVALVAQETWLVNGTLEDNVRLANPQASTAEVAQAIEQAALSDFVASLPRGLATTVGERGVALSGGQRQRIAIARAFLRNAPVLILDEATSHLDTVSEAQIHLALARLMRSRTTLVIAHRLSTIRNADLIAVVQGGRIVETGSHEQLLARQGAYARLLRAQLQAARRAA